MFTVQFFSETRGWVNCDTHASKRNAVRSMTKGFLADQKAFGNCLNWRVINHDGKVVAKS